MCSQWPEKLRINIGRVEAIDKIAFRLKEPQDALAVIEETRNEYLKSAILAKIALKRFDPVDAFILARDIIDSYWKAKTMACIAVRLPELMKTEALREAISLAGDIEDERNRAEIWQYIAYALAELPPSTLYSLWRESLHVLAYRTRKDFY